MFDAFQTEGSTERVYLKNNAGYASSGQGKPRNGSERRNGMNE